MDGTLLNSNHEVSTLFFELFEKLHAKGIHFVAASGRQYHSMVEKLQPIKERVLFVAENGALIKKNDKTLMTTPLAKSYLNEILSRSSMVKNAHPVLCTAENAFVLGTSPEFIGMLKEYYSQVEVLESFDTVYEDILKVAIYHFDSSETYIYPEFKDLEDHLKIKVSGANWLDVSAQNAHKGHALKKVMKKHNIKPNELLVFGDYNNDIEMLELADFSFAMANAHPNVKKVAKYETSSHNDFGVERVLEKILA